MVAQFSKTYIKYLQCRYDQAQFDFLSKKHYFNSVT